MKNILTYIKSYFNLKNENKTAVKIPTPTDPNGIKFKLVEQSKCPICEQGELLCGPRGGLAVNVECNNCYSDFNVLFIDGECRYIEGINGTHFPKLSR